MVVLQENRQGGCEVGVGWEEVGIDRCVGSKPDEVGVGSVFEKSVAEVNNGCGVKGVVEGGSVSVGAADGDDVCTECGDCFFDKRRLIAVGPDEEGGVGGVSLMVGFRLRHGGGIVSGDVASGFQTNGREIIARAYLGGEKVGKMLWLRLVYLGKFRYDELR